MLSEPDPFLTLKGAGIQTTKVHQELSMHTTEANSKK